MKKTFLLFAALIIGATSANAQRFISTDAMTAKNKTAVKESVAKPFKKQIANAAKDFTYGPAVVSVGFDDPTQYVMENLPGHTAGTGAGMFHRFDTSATSATSLQSTFPRFYSFFGIGTNGFYWVSRYVGGGDPSGGLIGDGFAVISPYDVYSAEGTNTKAFNTVIRLTEPIPTTGFKTVDVVFNQYTMRFNDDRFFVDYSTDANFATYDSIEFNVKGIELGSNEMTRGQKIVTLPVANSVNKTALYVRLRYKCNRLTNSAGAYITNLPSGYRWAIDEINVYDGPEYRVNVISTNHNYAAYGVVPQTMPMDTLTFASVVENTGGNTLFTASAEERYHNADQYVFPNVFTSFLNYTNVSATPQNITNAIWVDTVRNTAGSITSLDIRRYVDIEARSARQYNQVTGLYGISSGIKYLESLDSTTFKTIPMQDSIYYRVSEMPPAADPIGKARWASDVDVLIEGSAWAYGFEEGYISEVAPGSAVAGYEVCNRFVTPSDLPENIYFAKGVELVPAADSCDAGLQIQVSLKYMDFAEEAPDAYIKPFKVNNVEVMSNPTTTQTEGLNNGVFTAEGTEWTTTYNSIYLPFVQENVALQPDQWYYACYKLLDDGRFLVGRDDKDYLPTFKSVDWWSKLVMTPGQESEGYAWGYPFGDWFSKNSQPMIRLMVSRNPNSISEINNVPSFNLNAYPNPAQNETTIEYTLTSNSNVLITVTDIMGREIVRINEGVKAANTVNRVSLNTNNLNNGTYFYTINVNGVKETKKLVINK